MRMCCSADNVTSFLIGGSVRVDGSSDCSVNNPSTSLTMIVFKDRISGDELFTDSYKYKIDGVFYKVFGKQTTEGAGDDFNIGANPSAEEAQESTKSDTRSGCDIVLANRLQETTFNKKSYKAYISAYMKKLLEILPEERKASFKTEMVEVVKGFIIEKYDDWQFFLGENMDPDGMVCLMEYVEDPVTKQSQPYMLFFRDGLVEEKQ